MGEKNRLISIIGPTACGKSDLAVAIAEKFSGEIISADSRQVYRGLDIGTGKITAPEMRGIPHHLLDVADVRNEYTVAHFKKDAEQAIADIATRGKLPILCGGTGFWVDTVARRLVIPPVPPNPALRAALAGKTTAELFEKLRTQDPVRAAAIDERNPLRLVRALEIVAALGQVPAKTYLDQPYDLLTIGVVAPKEVIDARIARRLDMRIEAGMVDEIRGILSSGVPEERLLALGLEYRHVTMFIRGEYPTQDAMRDALYRDIVHYAKRQMTWFKRHPDIKWIDIGDTQTALSFVTEWLAEGKRKHDIIMT